ncbi:hypothetical protein HUA78_19110 [Myxococcus sp. CA033]|uniref:hypothetical protein n=1 Tax=Myxococcus sp. CA033 TaxID=2741516 RepID=UPI00157AED08|nr:hypothetical protein [Myxococcus sp. CA033]NTX36557.1 hypothetical protein [Myxococcus sp. CA033]
MLCSFCKREEMEVRLECDTCAKKFFICLKCWNGWRGKVTHCGKLLDVKRFISRSDAHPPLDELLGRAAAEGRKFQSRLSLSTIEMFVCSPLSTYGSTTTSDLEEVVRVFALKTSVATLRSMLFADYVEFTAKHNLESGSCGATSSWMDDVTTVGGDAPAVGDIGAPALLSLLENTPGPYYCRISRKPHSFMVERLGDEVRVYQSYASKYSLAHCLEAMRPMSHAKFCEDFTLALTELGTGEEVRQAKKRLFLIDVHWSQPRIQYRLNAAPARSSLVLQNLQARLQAYRGEWATCLTKTIEELAPDPVPQVFATAPLGPLELVDTRQKLLVYFDEDTFPDPLQLGMDVDGDLGGYRVVAQNGDVFTLRRR